jgi:hypothetical protein
LHWLRQTLFAIRPREVNFIRMGAKIDPEQTPRFEVIAGALRTGFNLTLADDRLDDLTTRVSAVVEPQCVGFAHEGVGMCLTLLDAFRDHRRIPRFFEHCRGSYDIFVTLGIGFALARAPWVPGGVEARAAKLEAPYDGMVLNGYGFHEACFKSGGALHKTPKPRGQSASGLRCFDHGLGRAMWFMCGGSPERIQAELAGFAPSRRTDLWAGLGTACAFAGRAYPDEGQYRSVLLKLDAQARQDTTGEHKEAFDVGLVLAAELVRRTGHQSPWVAQATQLLLGMSDVSAGGISERAWAEAHRETSTGPFSIYHRFAEFIRGELARAPLKAPNCA